MEESDELLYKALIHYGFQVDSASTTLSMLQTDELLVISIQFLAKMGLEAYEVSSLKTLLKGSKFRLGGKVQEYLLKLHGIRIDIQTLLNPNINETRKLIVTFLSKLSSGEDEGKVSTKQLTFDERVIEEQQSQTRKIMQDFVEQEWVNPTLLNHPTNQQRFLKLHVQNILKKEPLIKQVANQGVRLHLYNSLVLVHPPSVEGWEGNETLQTRIQMIKKMRRQEDPDAFLAQYKGQLEEVDSGLTEDWEKVQAGGRALKKAIKQLKEEDKEEEEMRKQKEDENQNIFAQEIQEQIKEQQQNQVQLNYVEKDVKDVRVTMREDLEKLTIQLKEKEQILEKYTEKRQRLDELNQKKIEDVWTLKEYNNQQQGQVETKHLVLQQLESSTANQVEGELKKMEEENESIKKQWFNQKIEIEGEIEAFRTKTNERKEKLEQMRDKVKMIDKVLRLKDQRRRTR